MKLPFEIDLTGKVCVVTGAGGVLCSMFAEALAKTGAKVALLDLNEEAAKEYADKINKDGGIAKGYLCNVLGKESIEKAHEEIVKDFGTCDILINGAGTELSFLNVRTQSQVNDYLERELCTVTKKQAAEIHKLY